MGTCSSQNLRLSIDVKGNNNYAVLLNGIQIDLTSALHDIINQINSESRTTTTIVFCLTSICLILILGIIGISIESYIIMKDIKYSINDLDRKLEKLASQTEYLSLSLLQKRSIQQVEYIHIDKYSESFV